MSRHVLRLLGQVNRLQKIRADREATRPLRRFTEGVPSIVAFVPMVSPKLDPPHHLRPLTKVLERELREPIEVCVSVPPRHGKTTVILHWIAWCLVQDPTLTFAYVSHGGDFAKKQCRKAMLLTARAGVKLGDKRSEGHWETWAGGGCVAAGIGGGLAGEGFRIVIVDDPFRNRAAAESPTSRGRVVDAFQSDLYTRQEPAGTSFVVVHTRWHDDDLIGNLERGMEGGTADQDDDEEDAIAPFEIVNLPAIDPSNDDALWPKRWNRQRLRKIEKRIGPWAWTSLYLGRPEPRSGRQFGKATYYDSGELPSIGIDGGGVDLAYTKRTKRCYSVLLIGRKVGPDLYLTGRIKRQCRADEFRKDLDEACDVNPGMPLRFYYGAAEKGSADLMISMGIPLEPIQATMDKLIRAGPAAAAWNDTEGGRILVPRNAEWARDFVRCVRHFTGVNDPEDDDVDALAALWDLLDDQTDIGNIQTGGHHHMAGGLKGAR